MHRPKGWLYGLGGDDLIKAGGGSDHIFGGKGNDALEGGAQNDTFYFDFGDGGDKITDFRWSNNPAAERDVIALSSDIDGYWAFANDGYIRIVTLADNTDNGVSDPVKAGSIGLYGVTASMWESWGGHVDTYSDPTTGAVVAGSNAMQTSDMGGLFQFRQEADFIIA